MSRTITIFVCVATVLGLSCRPRAERQTEAAASDIPVGVYAASSGSEAAFGQATVQGEKLAAEEINNNGGVLGRKIRLIIEDDQGKAEEAASVVVNRAPSCFNCAIVVSPSSCLRVSIASCTTATRRPH